jgi:hypothetical protein
MKPHGCVWFVRRWCSLHVGPVRRCFDDPDGLNNGYLPSRRDPQVHELANSLRLGTVVPSQDLSGAWVTFAGESQAGQAPHHRIRQELMPSRPNLG